jgi:RNA polymerase sigma factor (sigma-70 family)
MRRILIDRARKRQVRRSSGLAAPEELHESQIEERVPEAELFALHEVLDSLGGVDADAARLVKLRYFVGMEVAEAAEALGISLRQAERLWTFAKAWLRAAIQRDR